VARPQNQARCPAAEGIGPARSASLCQWLRSRRNSSRFAVTSARSWRSFPTSFSRIVSFSANSSVTFLAAVSESVPQRLARETRTPPLVSTEPELSPVGQAAHRTIRVDRDFNRAAVPSTVLRRLPRLAVTTIQYRIGRRDFRRGRESGDFEDSHQSLDSLGTVLLCKFAYLTICLVQRAGLKPARSRWRNARSAARRSTRKLNNLSLDE